MAKAVKLADIAAIVGVSTVTVSKALSDQKGVSEELRERIKQLADEMGYKQPSVIKKAAVNTSYNIGVLIAEQFLSKYDSFYWLMYQSITTITSSKGCFSMLEVVSAEDEQEGNLPKLIQEKKADALIVIGGMRYEYLQQLKHEGGVPVTYLDFYDKNADSDAIISNSFYGTYLLTDYLYNMGHRKIAYVGTLMATDSITDRYLGFRKAMMEHNLVLRDDWVIPDRDMKTGMIDLEKCMQLPREMPTAFVCNCDLTAGYMVKILRNAGLSVPEDVSVVGFDNFIHPGVCDLGITTYEVRVEEMAKTAIEHILKKIENPACQFGTSIIEGRLLCKESVRRV